MTVALTRKIPTRLALCFAGLVLLMTRAGAVEPGLADTDGALRIWRQAEGLPSDAVTTLIQTSDGYLWVGTSAGLVRFDGVKFTAVQLAGSTNNPIRISALCEDSKGR